MSRLHRFVHGATSGAALLLVNALFSLASIPMALRFLDREQFGLWALGVQMTSYLMFVDLGMSSSLARFLIDHKDDRTSGKYGAMIRSGLLVFGGQAILILLLGLGSSLLAPRLFDVPQALRRDFFWLMVGLTIITAASFLTRIFVQLLQAHQRMDIHNYVQILQFIVSFIVLWLSLKFKAGIFSLLVVNAAGWLVVSFGSIIACRTLGLWPKSGEWGPTSWISFREMFFYGTDLFWIALATQLITSSQTMIASRALGGPAAGAIWSVMTKPFSLVCQLVWRLVSGAMPAFAEIQVRGEMEHFWSRYRLMFTAINALSGFCAVLFAFLNRPFIALWTGGKMDWSVLNDWLLGLWLVLLTQVCSHNYILITMRKIGALKYAYFGEAVVFVLSALVLAPLGGFSALIGCSIVCTLVFTFAYGNHRVARDLRAEGAATLWTAQVPLFRVLAVMVPLAGLLYGVVKDASPAVQIGGGVMVLGVGGGLAFLRLAVPQELIEKLDGYLPRRVRAILRRIVPLAPTME